MNKDKINKLYHTLIIGLESKESKDDNFHKFLIEINLKAHWVTKISIKVLMFFLDFISILKFFRLFKNLNKDESAKILEMFSKIIFLKEITDMLKKYALMFLYDKNQY